MTALIAIAILALLLTACVGIYRLASRKAPRVADAATLLAVTAGGLLVLSVLLFLGAALLGVAIGVTQDVAALW